MKKIIYLLPLLFFFISCKDDNSTNKNISLTQIEIDDLKFMREEEKLAYDVYSYAFEKYNIQIFSNIASSELQHTSKILTLIQNYDLEDPVGTNENGIYSNSVFQELYTQLIGRIDQSLNEAYQVGALIEDLDIQDLEDRINRTNKNDIINVYENLQCGSRNHLRSYYAQILNINDTYSPQYISQEIFDSIINGSTENCGQN